MGIIDLPGARLRFRRKTDDLTRETEPDTMAGIFLPPFRLASPHGYGRVVDFPKSPNMI
ncbi:hypothetical protein NQZ68_023172 [Dissostichus eleginoides]|nr:hypothetical protein NQZ68_023172 [Dissostichus eleginoides]